MGKNKNKFKQNVDGAPKRKREEEDAPQARQNAEAVGANGGSDALPKKLSKSEKKALMREKVRESKLAKKKLSDQTAAEKKVNEADASCRMCGEVGHFIMTCPKRFVKKEKKKPEPVQQKPKEEGAEGADGSEKKKKKKEKKKKKRANSEKAGESSPAEGAEGGEATEDGEKALFKWDSAKKKDGQEQPAKKKKTKKQLKSAMGTDGGDQSNVIEHPFETSYNDHFETQGDSVEDILPLLEALRVRLYQAKGEDDEAVAKEKFSLYDPYFCTGTIADKWKSLGVQNVFHENRDFYADIEKGEIPDYDCLVTNPPFSGMHMQKLFTFLAKAGKPYMVLMPSFNVTKPWFKELFSNEDAPYPEPMYVVPKENYQFDHPHGVGKGEFPLRTMWYVYGGPDCHDEALEEAAKSLLKSHLQVIRGTPAVIEVLPKKRRIARPVEERWKAKKAVQRAGGKALKHRRQQGANKKKQMGARKEAAKTQKDAHKRRQGGGGDRKKRIAAAAAAGAKRPKKSA